MNDVRQVLKQADLSKTEAKIRNYIFDHGIEVCFMTSTDLALASEVSEATVIRFCRKLGFTGYIEFLKYLQAGYQRVHNRISQNITVPHQRLIKSMEHGEEDFLSEYAVDAQKNISSAIGQNPRELYDKAVDILVDSKAKYVFGSRANFGLATCTYFLLNSMLPGMHFANNPAANMIDNLCGISRTDCMLAFSFPRYSKGDQLAVDMALDAGAKLIVITDRNSAPVAAGATIVFTVEVSSAYFFNSFIGAQHILESLCAGVSKRIGRSNEERLKTIDKYLDKIQLY